MLMLPSAVKIYLASQPTDMRKSIDGLLGLVRSTLTADPYQGHLFVFIGRARDRVKILFFDQGGFVVYYKRLERKRFQVRFPEAGATHVELEATELAMLLRGIDFSRVKQPVLWRPAQSTAA
jgi:transposase